MSLLSVNITQIEDVKSEQAPFNTACKRCEDAANYDEDTELCTCTPACGSCAKEEYSDTNTGSRCFELNEALEGSIDSTLIKGGGAIKQGAPDLTSAQCGFGRAYRTHKRGYIYDASTATIPTDSIVLLDMRTEKVHCKVDLPGSPSRVAYVPTRGSERSVMSEARSGDSDDGLSAGAIVGIVFGGLVVLALAAYLALRNHNGSPDAVEAPKDAETSQGDSSDP